MDVGGVQSRRVAPEAIDLREKPEYNFLCREDTDDLERWYVPVVFLAQEQALDEMRTRTNVVVNNLKSTMREKRLSAEASETRQILGVPLRKALRRHVEMVRIQLEALKLLHLCHHGMEDIVLKVGCVHHVNFEDGDSTEVVFKCPPAWTAGL